MAPKGLHLQALMNSAVQRFYEEDVGTPDEAAHRLFALTEKSLSSSGRAPAVSAVDVVQRHRRRKLDELNGATTATDPLAGGLSAAVFSYQAQRLKALSAELRRASVEDLRHVRNERVARRLCRMFQLPNDVYVSWKRAQSSMLHPRLHQSPGKAGGGGSASLSLSPSPTKRRGKRKSPDRMAAASALRHSRFAPTCGSGNVADLPSPLVRRRSSSSEGGSSLGSYGGGSGNAVEPRQLCFDCTAETMDVDAARSPPKLAASDAAVSSSHGSGGCPEWLLFRTALASPPLRSAQLQQRAQQGQQGPQQDSVESTCWEAERQVEVASRILAGRASPNSLAAAAAAVGAPLHPLSPCHSDPMQPAAVPQPGMLPRRLTSGMSCAGLALVTTATAATAKENGAYGREPSSSGLGSLEATMPKVGLNAREWAQAGEDAALASATVMELESSSWHASSSTSSNSDSCIGWACSRAAGSFRSQRRGGRKQAAPSRSRLSSHEEPGVELEPSGRGLLARDAMGPSSSSWADRLRLGSIGLVADNRAYVVDAAALRAFAQPKLQAAAMFASSGRGSGSGLGGGVNGAIDAMQALDVRGRGHSIVRPITLLRVAAPVSGRVQHTFPCY